MWNFHAFVRRSEPQDSARIAHSICVHRFQTTAPELANRQVRRLRTLIRTDALLLVPGAGLELPR